MAIITSPFASSATRTAPSAIELTGGHQCGEADPAKFNWFWWYMTAQIYNAAAATGVTFDDADGLVLTKILQSTQLKVSFQAQSLNTFAVPNAGGFHTLTDLQYFGTPRVSASTFGLGVFTVGAGDEGFYQASLVFTMDQTNDDHTLTQARITPSVGLEVNAGDQNTAASRAPWVQAVWTGQLTAGATLNFQVQQVNSATAARTTFTGSHISVYRLGI